MKKIIFISALILGSILTGCESNTDYENHLIVTARYKAKANKSVDAVTGLKNLIEKIEKEDHFVSVRLHVDENDNSNIMLYEEWDDELYYKNQHMKTQHLQKFTAESQTFLDGQPEISYWKVNAAY